MNGGDIARTLWPSIWGKGKPPLPQPVPGSFEDKMNGVRAALIVAAMVGPWLPLLGALKVYDGVRRLCREKNV